MAAAVNMPTEQKPQAHPVLDLITSEITGKVTASEAWLVAATGVNSTLCTHFLIYFIQATTCCS